MFLHPVAHFRRAMAAWPPQKKFPVPEEAIYSIMQVNILPSPRINQSCSISLFSRVDIKILLRKTLILFNSILLGVDPLVSTVSGHPQFLAL